MRWAPLAVFLGFIAVALAWLARDPSLRKKGYAEGSSFGTGDEGLSLARAYLEKRGAAVSVLAQPLSQAKLPRDAVLLRIDPLGWRDRARASDLRETDAEEEEPDAGPADAGPSRDAGVASPREAALTDPEDAFVRGGGRLVLAVRGEELDDDDLDAPAKVAPLLPGVAELSPPEPRALDAAALVSAQPVFEYGAQPSVAYERRGAGEVWFLAEPEIFFNDTIADADHLALLEALTGGDGSAGDGRARPVVFDEQIHGLSRETGLFDVFRGWGLGPALLFAMLALCALWWREAGTIGPAQDPFRDPRSEAVELVDSMAALYRRALSAREALQLFRTRVVHELALKKGIGERRAEELLSAYAPAFDAAGDFTANLRKLVAALERLRHEHRHR